jgi:hypothetical protein
LSFSLASLAGDGVMLNCVDAVMCGFVFVGVGREGDDFTAAAVDA